MQSLCFLHNNDYQGTYIDQVAGAYGYKQIINEATNFEAYCDPSCTDLILNLTVNPHVLI